MKLVAARELAQLVASCKGAEADCALILPTGGACREPADSKLH